MTEASIESAVARPEAASVRQRNLYVDAAVWSGIALLPLVCWPDPESAFFKPKLAALLILAVLAAVWCWIRRTEVAVLTTWPPLVWTAAVSVSALASSQGSLTALLLAIGAVPLFWIGGAAKFTGAVAAASAVQSLVVLMQYAGADPLRWLGWQAEAFANPRMRVYGTLGNPDFVAAWCCATLPISHLVFVTRASTPRRATFGWCLVAAQVAAIAATGSRAALPGLAAAALVAVLWGRCRKAWLAVLPLAAFVLLAPGSRSLGETIAGRVYLTRVALSAAADNSLTGTGPGSFEVEFARRQPEWLGDHPEHLRFAGAVDHAHNDYAELLVEYGPVGLAAFLLLLGGSVARMWPLRHTAATADPRLAALAGLAALAAIALVDFPFHRPAEWGLFWLLLGTTYSTTPLEAMTRVTPGT